MTAPAPIAARLADAGRPWQYQGAPWQIYYRRDVGTLLTLTAALCDRVFRAHEVLGKRAERRPAATFGGGEGI